jgi:hypothetical protein
MAFQDNSGDIIFDVVLTDEGRKRLAKGDGSFNIAQFALGDDEINYALYDKTTTTATQDLSILQTPVFEAFTNNMSSIKTKLMTIPRNDLLYLSVLKLNELPRGAAMHSNGAFVVAVDGTTENNNEAETPTTAIGIASDKKINEGIIFGKTIKEQSTYIRIDSGLDTTEIPPDGTYISDLQETGFIIEIDNRLGNICSKDGSIIKTPDFIDDDNVASYSFQAGTAGDPQFVQFNTSTVNGGTETIAGPRGIMIEFKIKSSIDLEKSSHLFTLLGTDSTMTKAATGQQAIKQIDSVVRVIGESTGYAVSVPVRFVKVV